MANVLVLVIDGLGCSYLGPYGNTWIDTPAWNRLAARSLLFETMLSDSGDLPSAYQALWHGRHRLQPAIGDSTPGLPAVVTPQMATCLVTDDADLADSRAAHDFEQRVILPDARPEQAATDLEQTQLAQLFAAALSSLEQTSAPFLMWVHARGMCGPWDAPYALRTRFAAEDDPQPPTFVTPPICQLAPDYDPDVVLGFQQAYAAQVTLLDTCLDVLLDALWSGPRADDTLLVTLSTRGYPLGEHRCVGIDAAPLYSELLQVPAMIHWPDGTGWADRAPHLVQPCDILPTLLNWLDITPPPNVWGRDLRPTATDRREELGVWNRAVACATDELAVRVPGWFARLPDTHPAELYVKPDDRCEVNDVADRCAGVVDEIRALATQMRLAARDDARDQLAPLPDLLHDDWG